MFPDKLKERFIQVTTNHSGCITQVVSGRFEIDKFMVSHSIYDVCPFLEMTLEELPLDEHFSMENMFIKTEKNEYNVDIEIFKISDAISITILNRTNVYKFVKQLNQSRNDTAIIRSQLDRQNKELERLRKLADKANEEKSRFLAMMSHEIRNPLNTILGYGEIILSESNSTIVKGYVNSLLRAGQNLKVIANDILDLSRIEAGKLTLTSQPISLLNVVETCVENLKLNFSESLVPLKYEVDKRLSVKLLGDSVRIQQILSNLIGNSFKFTTEGFIKVSAAIEKEDKQSIRVVFTVEDTGRGMNSGQAERIFDEYEQVKQDDYRLHKGAGLGLSIVKRLVDAMNGTVTVTSEVNKGTKFEIKILFAKANEKYLATDEKVNLKEGTFSLEGLKVLFADDDELSHVIVGHVLSQKGINTIMVKDGLEALEAIKSQAFDMILLDIRMPQMSGIELINKKEAFKQYNNSTPVLALTANTSPEDIDNYKRLGFVSVLSKPYSADNLVHEIGSVLAN